MNNPLNDQNGNVHRTIRRRKNLCRKKKPNRLNENVKPDSRRITLRRNHRRRHQIRREAIAAVHHHPAEMAGREINVKRSVEFIFLFTFSASIIASGCYTQLMAPQEFVQSRKLQTQSKPMIADNSYSVNYNQSCVTCHTVTELDERTEELEYYGVTTVHDGILLSAHQWNEPVQYFPPAYDPIFWPRPGYPIDDWWLPPATAIITPPTNGNGERIRTGGSTRDGNKDRDRSTPTTYTQPQTPVGGNGTTQTPSNPPPATTVTPQQPATPPAQTNDNARSRDSNDTDNSSSRTRNDGSSRDSSGNRPR